MENLFSELVVMVGSTNPTSNELLISGFWNVRYNDIKTTRLNGRLLIQLKPY